MLAVGSNLVPVGMDLSEIYCGDGKAEGSESCQTVVCDIEPLYSAAGC